MGRLTCELHRPGMTALHRVGLAGLYMTLKAFDRDPDSAAELSGAGVSWTLEDRKIELGFAEGREPEGMEMLIELSFQIDGAGFFRLPGLEQGAPPEEEQKWLLYQALLGTFLQFGPHRPTGKKVSRIIEIDDKQIRLPEFGPVTKYRHQEAHKDFIGKKGALGESVELVGWLYPGGAQRHVAWKQSMLAEPSELAFCLLFAPVGSIFFHVSSRRTGRKTRTALVLPQVQSLSAYARLRRAIAQHGVLSLTAASPTDAALQLAVMAKTQDLAENLSGPIRIMSFGIVDWNEKQKSRTATYVVDPATLPGMRNYEIASRIFKTRWQHVEAKTDRKGKIKDPAYDFVKPFTAREIIADNIARRRPWHAGFADYLANKETRISLQFECKELFQMTQKADYDYPNERIFIQTCHEAWRRRLGRLSKRAEDETKAHKHLPREQYDQIRKKLFQRLANGERDKLRSSLVRCKNTETLRSAVTDFWSRAGSLPSLHEGWQAVLPLLDQDWCKARDLALLAIASYQPQTKEEEQVLDPTNQTNDQGQNP